MAPSGPPDLTELLAALRAEGIAVGPAELIRLHHVFGTAPRLDREALRRFLASLLVKSREQRNRFDRLFDLWCPDRPAEWMEEGVQTERPPRGPSKPGQTPGRGQEGFPRPQPVQPRHPWIRVAIPVVALILAAILVVLLLRPSSPTREVEPPEPDAVELDEVPDEPDALPANPAPRVWYWRAGIAEVRVPDRLAPEELALLSLLAGLALAGLWWRYRRRIPPPDRLPPLAGGPGWLPLAGIRGSDTALTSPRERRGFIWNLARFSAEDLTRRLDEPATVAATAGSGGLAEIRYQRARFPREVWLWLDEHTDDPSLTRLADEIEQSLKWAGLGVRRGSFAGTPTRIWWRRDDHFAPTHVEGHRRHALVAILTEGAGIVRDLGSPLRARQTERMLRQLRLWPHLTLVDFGPPGPLARVARRLGLGIVRPADLAAWLGGQTATDQAPAAGPLLGDRRIWAAACCLGAEPPDPETAQRLRRHLGLNLDAWSIRDLQRDAGAGGDLSWPEARRRALVDWLLRLTPLVEIARPPSVSAVSAVSAISAVGWADLGRPNGPIVGPRSSAQPTSEPSRKAESPPTPASQAIGWWRSRYQAEAARHARRQKRLLPWSQSRAQRRWMLEDALLQLLLDPVDSVPRLKSLAAADPALKDEIRARLAGLRSAEQRPCEAHERSEEGLVHVPWRLQDLPALLQADLVELGFGGAGLQDRHRGIRPPAALSLSLGLLAGIALAAAGVAVWRWLSPPGIELVSSDPQLDHPAMRAQTLHLVDDRSGWIAVGSGKGAVVDQVRPGARVTLDWTWEPPEGPGNNPVRLDGDGSALIFRAGTLAQPIRPCVADWPERALAVILDDPEAVSARRLAIRLLDSGSADQVLVAEKWRPGLLLDFAGRDRQLNSGSRLLLILPEPRKPSEILASSDLVRTADPGVHASVGSAVRTRPPAPDFQTASQAPTLDSGSIETALRRMEEHGLARTAMISADEERLARWLRFPGTRPLNFEGDADLAPAPIRVLDQQGSMPWHGGPEQELDPGTGIAWVRICPGTFTMGSDPATDPMSQEDERPAHPVVLSAFEIASTETTNAQYRRSPAGAASGLVSDDKPAVGLNWTQARAFCRWAGGKRQDGDLPTEAQWEYAARGGTISPWSFGTDPDRLGDFAWFDDNSGREAHSVARKKPNPLGLFDLHGNVYEWLRDWYGEYVDRVEFDPSGADSGDYLVLRGGSFDNSPVDLRSADRVVVPAVWRSLVGFRCVRVASPSD